MTIYSHGLLIITGVIAGALLCFLLAKRARLETHDLLDNLSTTVLLGIIGARIAYAVVYHDQLSSFWQTFYIWQGGLVSWGGILVGLLVLLLLFRHQNKPIRRWFDIVSISFLLGLAIGRIGCYLAGDLQGKISSSYPQGFPLALWESGLSFVLFLVLLFVHLKVKNLKNSFITVYAVFGYSLIRLIIDGNRIGDKIFLNLNSSQIFAAVVAVILLFYYLRLMFSGRRKYAKT